jgi:transcriptional regulator with GAF, ATPase, and Fis domain
MSPSPQPGVAVPENDPGGSARPPLEMLRGVTRHVATAEDLEEVLQSIVAALVAQAGAANARIYLALTDDECLVCRTEKERAPRPPSPERALHCVASAGLVNEEHMAHRVAFDSTLPPGVAWRLKEPSLVSDPASFGSFGLDPAALQVWREMGINSTASYPLELRGEKLGLIGFIARRRITAEEFALLGIFADQAALSIRNAQLYREVVLYRERLAQENAYLQAEIAEERGEGSGVEGIVGESPALRAVLRKVRQVAPVETTVLLLGETGTGKELLARALHQGSPRRERPLIKVNCGALPQGVVESELFGHERGAFTGALQRRIGRFELADKGTLFMDEVGELPLDTQVKLLRVLQEGEFERVGSAHAQRVDVRLVAATNRDLEQEVAQQRFRADLFYRLNVFPIRVPPLRERPSDIALLARHFLALFQRKLAKPLKAVTPEGLRRLERYSWPGNIRELQNVLERACVLSPGPLVDIPDDLRPGGTSAGDGASTAPAAAAAATPPPDAIVTLEEGERIHIRRALAVTDGRIHGPDGAAALLGINPSTLRSRMKKLGITRQRA